MGASLALILANVWMKSLEASLQKPELSENISKSDQNRNGKDCNRRVTFRGKGVESCKNWFHTKCQTITNEDYANMSDVAWIERIAAVISVHCLRLWFGLDVILKHFKPRSYSGKFSKFQT